MSDAKIVKPLENVEVDVGDDGRVVLILDDGAVKLRMPRDGARDLAAALMAVSERATK